MAILETISIFPFSSSFQIITKKKGGQHHVNAELVPYINSAIVGIKLQQKETYGNNYVGYNVYSHLRLLLQSCEDLAELKQIHANIFKCGGAQNVFLATKLVDLYGMFDSVDEARLVFNKMQEPNSFLWNTIIRACANNDLCEETIALYKQMQCAGIRPDKFTFPFVIKACAGLSDLQEGREIHEFIVKEGLELDVYIGSALTNMYAKCGSILDARQVFDKMPERNFVSWDTMIAGYLEIEDGNAALGIFQEMQLAGIGVDCACIVGGLRACGLIRALQHGKSIHAKIIRSGFESDFLVATPLVDMYAKCGSIYVARQLFDKMRNRDVFLWNIMIAAYAQNGHAKEALETFCQMQQTGMKVSSLTFATVIPALAHLGRLKQGKWIHACAIRSGFECNKYIATALIDMYAKCGSIEIARRVFDKISQRDVVLWTAMISGYGMHGCGERALAVFNEMQEAGMKPDCVTFVGVLSACSRAGLLHEGWQYFDHMISKFNIQPTVKHYACMVDLLGRAGRLKEAYDFIRKKQLEPHACVWGALLGACGIHYNIELAEHAAEHLFNLEPKNASWYVLLSNVYAIAGRWDDLTKVTRMMEEKGLRKLPENRLIDVYN